jgi:hypothetical protein
MAGEVHVMPVTIWEPARYADGFAHNSMGIPINGDIAAAPHDKDAKVCEICAFEGWKEVHYCDGGEFEITTADVAPEHIKRGNFVNFDGDFFIIDDYDWEIVDGTYVCTFSGRDFWKFPNSEIARRAVGTRYGESGLTGAFLFDEIDGFFSSTNRRVGWFRDERRFAFAEKGSGEYRYRLTSDGTNGGGFASKGVGVQVSNDVMSYGAEWRLFANMLQCGIRFDVVFNSVSGLFEVRPIVYDGRERDIVINSRDAGVSGFRFGFAGRAEVNAVYSVFKSGNAYWGANLDNLYENEGMGEVWFDMNGNSQDVVSKANVVKSGDAANFAQLLVSFSEVFSDLGDVPSEVDASSVEKLNDVENWALAEMEKAIIEPTTSFEFAYNNGGAYRFGEHFGIGDKITIVDDYLGVSSSQKLTTVKTVYSVSGKRFEFEFTNQRIKQSDVLKRRFYELNRRTLTRGKL